MKKQYSGLVDAFKIVALFVFIFGVVGVVAAALGRNDGITALALGISVVVTTLLINGIAAIIDLLATIEVNTRTTAAYFERRMQPADDKPVTTPTKRKTP